MKQGTGHSTHTGQKTEPTARAVNPSATDQLGQALGTQRSVVPMYEGRGYEAPKANTTIHDSGSQGRH